MENEQKYGERKRSTVQVYTDPYINPQNEELFPYPPTYPAGKIKVPHLGEIVAFQEFETRIPSTVVPGIFSRELGNNEEGSRRIEVKTIPDTYPRIRKRVSKVLKERDFVEPVSFW